MLSKKKLVQINRMRRELAYDKFVADAKLAATRKLGIPRDWWGVWKDVHGPGEERVFFSSRRTWMVSLHGKYVSEHDSRSFAISKARKLK